MAVFLLLNMADFLLSNTVTILTAPQMERNDQNCATLITEIYNMEKEAVTDVGTGNRSLTNKSRFR